MEPEPVICQCGHDAAIHEERGCMVCTCVVTSEHVKILDAAHGAFMSLAVSGANHDINHPGREAWRILRDALFIPEKTDQ